MQSIRIFERVIWHKFNILNWCFCPDIPPMDVFILMFLIDLKILRHPLNLQSWQDAFLSISSQYRRFISTHINMKSILIENSQYFSYVNCNRNVKDDILYLVHILQYKIIRVIKIIIALNRIITRKILSLRHIRAINCITSKLI